MGQGVLPSDLSLLMVDTQLSRDGTTLDLTGPMMSGTTFTYTIQLYSFGRNDSGNYTCTANVALQQPSTYLIGMGRGTAMSKVVTGETFCIKKCFISQLQRKHSNLATP